MEKQVKVGLDRKQKEGAKARSNRLFGIIRNIYPRNAHAEMQSFPTYEKRETLEAANQRKRQQKP